MEIEIGTKLTSQDELWIEGQKKFFKVFVNSLSAIKSIDTFFGNIHKC